MVRAILCTGMLAALLPAISFSQQVTVTTPLIGVHDSFYEHINLGWGMHRSYPGGSWFLNFGGPMSAIPPYGGYNPANDFGFGFGFGSSSPFRGAQFQMSASQGSNRSMTMVAPSVTMMNGARGQIFSGSIRPFVTGLIPVVGDYPVMVPQAVYPTPFVAPLAPTMVSPLAEKIDRLRHEEAVAAAKSGLSADRLVLDEGAADAETEPILPGGAASTAERGDISLAEIRRLQAAEDEARRQEMERLIDQARQAQNEKQYAMARIYYKRAAARTSGSERQRLLDAADKVPTSPPAVSR